MNKHQFRSVRHQLGLNEVEMGRALNMKKEAVRALESPILPKQEISHVIAYACAWMLLNGGPFIPWPVERDRESVRSFMRVHGLSPREMAALMDVSERTIKYMTASRSAQQIRPSPRSLMAICWMRLFGSRDPFSMPVHHLYEPGHDSPSPFFIRPSVEIDADFHVIDV